MSPHATIEYTRPRSARLFDGFFFAGFECSDHRLENGRRLDLLSSTRHREFARRDYALLRELGIRVCREGVSWVACEPSAAAYDFSTVGGRLAAARDGEMTVVWDLMHFGWPDHIDVFSPEFAGHFGRYAAAFARWLAGHGEASGPVMICPINEMSFLSWAGGDVGIMNPFAIARGVELKVQLVRATIAAIDAIRSLLPGARFLHSEPAIQIVPAPDHPKTWRRVACDNALQYQALDMLSGRMWPDLGGDPRYLDIVGVNYYPDNQFMLDGMTVPLGDERHKPFHQLLLEISARYERPMILSETGAEGDARATWLRYAADECALALERGCELHGVTLYPVLNHPGWADDRHCLNGLWDYPDADGARAIHQPLADVVRLETPRLIQARARMLQARAEVTC